MDNAADRCGRANTHAWFDREGLQELAVNTHSRYGVNNKTKQPDKKHRHPTSSFFSVGLCGYHGKGTKTWHLEKMSRRRALFLCLEFVHVCVRHRGERKGWGKAEISPCSLIDVMFTFKYLANISLLYK